MTATRATAWHASSGSSTRRCWWCRRSSASGIFLTPGTVADILPHPGLVLAAWSIGGLLSLAGALANAELGAMYPHAGGDYVYLREAYHPLAGFLVGLAVVLRHLRRHGRDARGGLRRGARALRAARRRGSARRRGGDHRRDVEDQLRRRARRSARQQRGTAVKIVALAVIAAAGLAVGSGSFGHFQPLLAGASDVPARRLRPRALAGAVHLSRLECVGLRRAARSATPAAPSRARCSSASASAPASICC